MSSSSAIAHRLNAQDVRAVTLVHRETLLRDLLRHARIVTGTDVAFFGEPSNDGIVLRYFTGHQSDALLNLGVPYGRGLGGACASQLRALVVPQYFNETRITHEFDRRVHSEGLESLIAFPVQVEEQLAGVLYVATRQRTHFSNRVVREIARAGKDTASALYVSGRICKTMDVAVSEDRRQLAIRLHDTVGQMLFGIGATARELGTATQGDKALHARVAQLQQQISEASAMLRDAMTALSAPPSEMALAVQVYEDVETFQQRSGLRAQLLVLSEIPVLSGPKVHALSLACREALFNAEKHAQCSAVVLTLYCVDRGVGLAVVDDGVGYDVAAPLGIGILACTQRLERLGGAVSVATNEDGPGTSFRAWVPC